jgi:isomerase DpgB
MSSTLIENRPVIAIEVSGDELLSGELTRNLTEALDEAEDRGPDDIMLVHVVGAASPEALRPWPGPVDILAITKWERLLRRMERGDSTTITLVEHACSALALELLLVSDRRLARPDFSLQFATTGSHAWPGMALYRLSRQLGESQVRRLLLDATSISAERCVELKILDKVVDKAGNGSDPIAHLLGTAPSNDFPICRRLIQDSLCTHFDDALGLHLAACDRALRRAHQTSNERLRES